MGPMCAHAGRSHSRHRDGSGSEWTRVFWGEEGFGKVMGWQRLICGQTGVKWGG